jgi:hypothetical protein
VEARNAWPIRRQFFTQGRYCRREFAGGELRRVRGRPLRDIGEAEAVVEQGCVMLRLEILDGERLPRFSAQRRAREGRPEPVGASREIMPMKTMPRPSLSRSGSVGNVGGGVIRLGNALKQDRSLS